MINFLKTILILLIFSACSSTTYNPRRLHNAAGLPRYVDFIQNDFNEKMDEKFAASFGANRGVAWTDLGGAAGSNNFFGSLSYRNDKFAIGLLPFLSSSRVSTDDSANLGAQFFGAVNFGGGDSWRFSLQYTRAQSSNDSVDKGCAERTSGFFSGERTDEFFSKCLVPNNNVAHSKIFIKENGFSFLAEKNLGKRNSLLFIPSVYRTHFFAYSTLSGDAVRDTTFSQTSWNPSFMVAFAHRTEEVRNLFSIGLGVHSVRHYGIYGSKRHYEPIIDLRWQL